MIHLPVMSFDQFQALARLYAVGALDETEMAQFQQGLREFGAKAEVYLGECRQLAAAFALSLTPQPPAAGARQELLDRIRQAQPRRRGWFGRFTE